MKFCTAINCMDGRVQVPVHSFLEERFGATYVDMITEPGPNGILAAGADTASIDSILKRVRISVEKHGSVGVAVVGHHDCAGNPGPKEQQDRQTREAVERLRGEFPEVPVIGLWVGADWRVSELE